MQHEVVHRCSGTFAGTEFAAIPGLRRIISLRYMLRRALRHNTGNALAQPL
jgi:hypothetical protein